MAAVITVSSSEEGWLRKYITLIEEGSTSLTKTGAKYGLNRPCCMEEPQVFECLALNEE